MTPFAKRIKFFIKAVLVLVGNLLYGSFDKVENTNTEIKLSDSIDLAAKISDEKGIIIFLAEDSYVFGKENIFLVNIELSKEKKRKSIYKKFIKKKESKSISKKKEQFSKTLVSKRQFLNKLPHYFFKNSSSESTFFSSKSNDFKLLHPENINSKNKILNKNKGNNIFFDFKTKLTSIVNLSDRAPPSMS